MKPRHAAALALVGWYLMMPPIDPASRFGSGATEQQADLKAPLYAWWITDTFDDLDQCKAAIASMTPKTTGGYWSHIQCISSEDLRLKGKRLQFVPGSN
jgi:hypothetical protein